MVERLRQLYSLVANGDALVEVATFGEPPYPEDTRHHHRKAGKAKTFTAEVAIEQADRALQVGAGFNIVAGRELGGAQVVVGSDLQGDIAKLVCDHRNLSGRGD